jgi:predicted membrane-bound mannosyltransferase
MEFKPTRWVLKEYNTQFVWLAGLAGITLILLLYYPQLTHFDTQFRNTLLICLILALAVVYFAVRYLQKSGRWTGE